MSQIARVEEPTPFGPVVVAVTPDGGAADAEIVGTSQQPTLVSGEVIDGCRRFDVTIRAMSRVRIASSMRLDGGPEGLLGYAGGQYVAQAQLIDETRGSLSLAAHDGIWLTSVAAEHGFVPARFAALPADAIQMLVRCDDHGVVVSMPELQAGESIRLFFACAWALLPRASDPVIDVWSAVELALPWQFPEHLN